MSDFAKEIQKVNIEDEMKQSYLDYAMSVIVGRALPDVRDGLKPVHRRSLYAMNELGNVWNKPYKKSARIVGDILGKYHPHGDSAVYDTIVRMAQPFSLRYPLVDGQGNFGSIDADSPAAMRYTEIRMAKIAHELIADIDKETVDFVPNYDGTEHEPTVFPTRLPNLLINGTSGIAVGMATNIPPHNIREVVDACIALIDNEDLSIEGLMHYIPGPDFPTAAIISGTQGILDAYRTGRGRLYIRSRTAIEDLDHGKQQIIVTELPYQVNKARLIEKIAELVKEKKLEGITEVRDESDKDGVRVVLELRRGEVAEVIQNNLFQHTQLQIAFGINIVALVDGQPRTLNLKQLLEAFLRHRREVVTRRSLFELRKARERTHILEGLAVALNHIDAIITLIKAAQSPQEARQNLSAQRWNAALVAQLYDSTELSVDLANYQLSDIQIQAILELRLHRLTGLEQDKILSEYKELLKLIADLQEILTDPDRLMSVIRQELQLIRDAYSDVRRTEIIFDHKNLRIEDLITAEAMVVTLSHEGYIKSQPLTSYSPQRRGGKGKTATQVKEEDFVDKLFIANTHDTILCFSTQGVVYWLKVYDLPQANRTARGKPIVNLLPLSEGERISAILPVREFSEEHYIFMATSLGTVKKTSLQNFSRPRSNGIIAIDLDEGDKLIGVDITDGKRDIMLFTREGNAARFAEADVRAVGRTARGVRGVRLENEQDAVIALLVTRSDDGTILTTTENGYGKRTPVADYAVKGRGGKGVITIKTSERNGKVISAIQVEEDDDVMLISNKGTLVRTRVSEISVVGRNTQGVGLIRLNEGEQLVGIARVVELDDGSSEPESENE